MNLVEDKQNLEKDRNKLIEERTKLIDQLKQIEIAIEQYNGAIAFANQKIKQQDEEDDLAVTSEPGKAEMKIQK